MGFLKFIQFQMPEMMKPYGIFHIISLIVMVTLAILLCVFARKIQEKNLNKFLMITWIVLVALEVYKQFVFSYGFDSDGNIHWHYSWYAFPYQFCATALTFLPFIFWNKASNKVSTFIREGCIAFACTFNFFAGVAVMLAPGDVFTTYNAGICVHTMIHHGMQMVLGVYLFVYYRKQLKLTSYLKALPIFGFFLINAMLLNIIVPKINGGETFNMFFISPYFDCTLPVLCDIYPKVPYIVFLMIYVVGFAIAGFLIYNIIYWINFLVDYLIKKIRVVDYLDEKREEEQTTKETPSLEAEE